MKKLLIVLGVVLVLFLILFGWWKGTYNSFVTLDENVKLKLGNLNNVYQQRSDLIPNLVATVQGAASSEQMILTDVISARSKATSIQLTPEALKDPQAMANFQQAQGQLTGALSRLMVVAEKYPELRSQGNFPVLMSQLEGQENRIRIERNNYNDAVREYNTKIRLFPSSMIASMSGFTKYEGFEAAAGAENAPKVNFNNTPAPANGTAPAGTTPAAPAPKDPHAPTRPAPVH